MYSLFQDTCFQSVVRSEHEVWSSGSAAELVALRKLGVSVMPVLTFLFARSDSSV